MSKGLETRTIVLLIVGLIILAVVFGILFLGTGPFSDAAKFGKCRGQLIAFCQGTGSFDNTDCAGQTFGSYKTFCRGDCSKTTYQSGSCPKTAGAGDTEVNCCNAFK